MGLRLFGPELYEIDNDNVDTDLIDDENSNQKDDGNMDKGIRLTVKRLPDMTKKKMRSALNEW